MSAPAAPEKDFLAAVIELAQMQGWLVMHQRPARTSSGWRTAISGDAGFPDLVLCHPPRLVILELKSQAGRVGIHQQVWLDALARCGVQAQVLRPSDWATLETTLRRR